MLEVVESFVCGKRGEEETCEDAALVTTPHHVAVIDGATTEPGHEIEGRAPGRFAMETLAAAIRALAPDAERVAAIGGLSRALAGALRAHGAEPGSLASATVLIASAERREIWRVGNSVFAVAGTRAPAAVGARRDPGAHAGGVCAGRGRARARRRPSRSPARTPGRSSSRRCCASSTSSATRADAGELAYAAIDGREVPEALIEREPLPGGSDVVFASDGYPFAAPTLAEAEEYLRASLAEDPLRIHRHPEVRGVRDGWVSYDDRAYVRFRAGT